MENNFNLKSFLAEGKLLKEDEGDNVDYTTDWGVMELINMVNDEKGTLLTFLNPNDPVDVKSNYSLALYKTEIEDVANGEKEYVDDGYFRTNMSKEEAQNILNQI